MFLFTAEVISCLLFCEIELNDLSELVGVLCLAACAPSFNRAIQHDKVKVLLFVADQLLV